jgi:predicted phosphodiesterase
MKCLILSDIHGNWPALRAVLAAEHDADQILCLGDLVNYGPQPCECITWAMGLSSPSRVIQGNHDRAFALETAPRCAPPNQQLAEAMQAATNRLLTPKMRRFLGALQPLQEFRCGEATCVACHSHATEKKGEPLDSHLGEQNTQWPWESDIVLLGHPDKLFVMVGHPDMLFLAHTHTPTKSHWGNTLAVNPGSVGLPTDGDPHVAYAVWQNNEITLHRLAYDVEETVRAFEPLDLDEPIKQLLIEGLRTGTCLATHPVAEPTNYE